MQEILLINESCYKDAFCGILQVSDHCAWDVLVNYIRERQRTDIVSLLGNCFYVDVQNNLYEKDYQDLLNGCEYEGCDGKKRIHYGLKTILAHLSYAAYAYRGGIVNTPFSMVQKMSQDSIPIPVNELRNVHDENRSIAKTYWELTHDFLCAKKDVFESFDSKDCKSCGCGGCGECDTCKSTGFKSHRTTKIKIIRR